MNTLYPIFLKVSRLHILIVGGGNVAAEKLHFLLKSSPNARVTVVAPEIHDDVWKYAEQHLISIRRKVFEPRDLKGHELIIATTDSTEVNKAVRHEAHKLGLLVNVADTPHLCDFYMGGIVSKGDVKIAISTNGTSPTLAKRLRQFFEKVIPPNIHDLAHKLRVYRSTLKDDFEHKVREMEKATEQLLKSG